MQKANIVKLTTYYYVDLHCPFCGIVAMKSEDEGEVVGCEHLLFINFSDFTVHLSDRYIKLYAEHGYKLLKPEDGDECFITKTDGSEIDDTETIDLMTYIDEIDDVVVFEQIVGPPSLESTFTVFAYVDPGG
jgi:hypothetical protein